MASADIHTSPQRVRETDASFTAAARIVRGTGSYPMERALAVVAQLGVLGGVLLGGIVLTALLTLYVHKAAGAVVFLLLCLGVAFLLMPAIDRRLWAMRAALTFLVTRQLLTGEAAPSERAAASIATCPA